MRNRTDRFSRMRARDDGYKYSSLRAERLHWSYGDTRSEAIRSLFEIASSSLPGSSQWRVLISGSVCACLPSRSYGEARSKTKTRVNKKCGLLLHPDGYRDRTTRIEFAYQFFKIKAVVALRLPSHPVRSGGRSAWQQL